MGNSLDRRDTTGEDDLEKPQALASALEQAAVDLPVDFEARQKTLVRKIDLRLLPVLVALYVMSFLDRVNIGGLFLSLAMLRRP